MKRGTVLAVAWCLSWSLGYAQDELPLRGPAAERLEEYKKLRMVEVLKLDEETSIRFMTRYNKYQQELKDLGAKRNALLDELQLLRRRNAGDGEFQKAIKELRDIGSPAIETRERFLDEAAKILPPRKLAEYLIFERNFFQNLREIMRDMQRERMRGRPF